MKIYVVNGYPQSGKDTFVDLCIERISSIYSIKLSTIDFIKEIAEQCGWNGEKNLKNRKFLSDLKDLLTDWGDVPYKQIEKNIQHFEYPFKIYDMPTTNCVIFIFCREPKEISKLVKRLNAKSIFIDRFEAESKEQSNHADNEVKDYNYDIIINNNGNLQELKNEVDNFLKKEDIIYFH